MPQPASAPAYARGSNRPSRSQWLQVGALAAVAGILYIAHSFLRFRNFEAKGYDLGIFDQAMRQYAQFRPPLVAIKGLDFNLLGDHFHPLIAIFAPFYWIWPDPRMINLVMVALLLATVPPVYLFARRRLGHVAAMFVTGTLLFFWPFQALVNWDFHEIALAVPIIAWILYCLDTGRFWWVVGLSIPLLGVREDMGATIAAIGLVLLLKRQWLKGAILIVVGLTGFALVYAVLVPALAPATEGRSYFEYSKLGATPGQALVHVLTHPLHTLSVLFDHPLKWLWWIISFVPFGLLPFASPYLIIAAPIILTRLFNDRLNVWAPVYQYDSVLLPIILAAFVDTLARMSRRWDLRRSRTVIAAIPLVISLVGTLFIPALFPLQRTLTGQTWAEPAHAKALQRAVDAVPSGVCVEATDNAAPHLTNRTYVGLIGGMGDDLASWVVVDTTVPEVGGWDPLTPQQALDRAKKQGFSPVIKDDDGVWLLHRDRPADPRCTSYVPNWQNAPHL